jgi:predicted Zn-dependent protease
MRNIIIITLLALSTATAGYYLAPNHREIALMQMNDSHFKDALEYYSSLQDKGDNSINVLAPLVNLHMHYGDVDQVIALLKPFLEKNPRSVEGHKKLASLYKASQRFHHYCNELEILQQLAPSADILRELADSYNFLGLHEREMHALARLVTAKGYRPREEDYINLASLFRINHQHAEAVEAVLAFVEFKKYDVKSETMQLTIQLMLETGAEQKALAISKIYLEDYGKEKDAIVLSSLFQKQSRFESAYKILEPFLADIDHSPDLLQQVASLQFMRGKHAEIYVLLSDQFKKGAISNDLAVTLIDLAVKYKDYALAETVIRTVALEQIPVEDLLRYADQWQQLKRANIARYMQTRLGEEYLRQSPLLAAVLNVSIHDTPEAMAALLALPPEYTLLPEQKMIVAGIYVRHGLSKHAFTLLDGMSATDMLGTLDAQQYAQLYLEADQVYKASESLNAARAKATPEMVKLIDNAILFLAAGEGNSASIQQWLKDHPADNGIWLADAHWLAVKYRRNDIALLLAKQMYQLEPSLQNRMALIDSQLLNHQYAEALGNLESRVDKDPASRMMYLAVMADWIHRVGINEVPASNRKTLETSIMSLLKQGGMSLDEKRNMAYLLQEAGLRHKAETIFVELAADQPFSSHDVSELLAFWGTRLPPNALSWIENRARSTSGTEQAEWLSHLNATRNPHTVLAVLRGTTITSTAVTAEYINALVATNNTKLLNAVLTQEIDRETNPAKVKRLATIALHEDLPVVSEKAWRKLYALNPGDADALKELGLHAFAINRYTEAGQLLEKYLQNNKGDYRVNYAYAEFLQRKGEKSQAKPFFEEALTQLSEMKERTLSSQRDKAHLLYRNNKLKESVALYNTLLSQFPANKALRADFAQFLIETRQFEEASLVLAQ